MKIAYISGPIKANTENDMWNNVSKAMEVATIVRKLEYAVICPHENSFMYPKSISYEEWIKIDIKLLSVCDLCILSTNDFNKIENSNGTIAELKYCIENGIPVYEIDIYGEKVGISKYSDKIISKLIRDSESF